MCTLKCWNCDVELCSANSPSALMMSCMRHLLTRRNHQNVSLKTMNCKTLRYNRNRSKRIAESRKGNNNYPIFCIPMGETRNSVRQWKKYKEDNKDAMQNDTFSTQMPPIPEFTKGVGQFCSPICALNYAKTSSSFKAADVDKISRNMYKIMRIAYFQLGTRLTQANGTLQRHKKCNVFEYEFMSDSQNLNKLLLQEYGGFMTRDELNATICRLMLQILDVRRLFSEYMGATNKSVAQLRRSALRDNAPANVDVKTTYLFSDQNILLQNSTNTFCYSHSNSITSCILNNNKIKLFQFMQIAKNKEGSQKPVQASTETSSLIAMLLASVEGNKSYKNLNIIPSDKLLGLCKRYLSKQSETGPEQRPDREQQHQHAASNRKRARSDNARILKMLRKSSRNRRKSKSDLSSDAPQHLFSHNTEIQSYMPNT